MKYIKSFENNKDTQTPQIGDYVIFKLDHESPWAKTFFSENNCTIANIITKEENNRDLHRLLQGTKLDLNNTLYKIQAYKETIPRHIVTTYINDHDIIYLAKTIEELETYKLSHKYNI